jgi:hypothetical protein
MVEIETSMATTHDTVEFDIESIGSASNVMLLAPSLSTAGSRVCGELLSVAPPSEENVLAVLLTDSPDDWLDERERNAGPERPAKTAFVTARERTRSAAAGSVADSALPGNMTIQSVSSPSDLTGLGMRISEQLSELSGDGNRIVVDFDSLTSLLEYAPRESVFKFVHVLKGRVDAADAVAHYHMDPAAHDDQEISTFKSLMDAVVEIDDDGTCSVSSR